MFYSGFYFLFPQSEFTSVGVLAEVDRGLGRLRPQKWLPEPGARCPVPGCPVLGRCPAGARVPGARLLGARLLGGWWRRHESAGCRVLGAGWLAEVVIFLFACGGLIYFFLACGGLRLYYNISGSILVTIFIFMVTLKFETLTFKIGGLCKTNRVFTHKLIPIYNFY